jgi:hypothetical protein
MEAKQDINTLGVKDSVQNVPKKKKKKKGRKEGE